MELSLVVDMGASPAPTPCQVRRREQKEKLKKIAGAINPSPAQPIRDDPMRDAGDGPSTKLELMDGLPVNINN